MAYTTTKRDVIAIADPPGESGGGIANDPLHFARGGFIGADTVRTTADPPFNTYGAGELAL